VPALPRLFTLTVVALALATLVGLALLWPGSVRRNIDAGLLADSDRGKVEKVSEFACAGVNSDTCRGYVPFPMGARPTVLPQAVHVPTGDVAGSQRGQVLNPLP
jgi:hypothetical protein